MSPTDGVLASAAVDALYDAAPDEFVARRDALAADLRAAGRRPDAAAVKSLRRPVAAAWVANALVRSDRAAVEEWTALGERLRQAQGGGDGAAVREASKERSRRTTSLLAAVRELAAEHGVAASEALLDGVRTTLDAALADPEAAERLLAARLTAPLEPVGFGMAGFGPVPVAAPREPARATGKASGGAAKAEKAAKTDKADRADKAAKTEREDKAAERRRAAERSEREAAAAATAAQEEAAAAQAQRAELTEALEQARERVRDLERRAADAALDVRRTARAAESAARAHQRAVAQRDRL